MVKKALVLGLGISGKNAATFLKNRGYEVVEVDDKIQPREITSIEEFDLFSPSPGVPRNHPLYKRALASNLVIKGEAELALSEIKQFCIGVTGTNGKTTVVKMIEHCLNFHGIKAKALGNVGDSLAEYVDQKGDEKVLVVELSSYQLETMSTKVFDVGVILNITEDHLDRYDSFEDYARAKAALQNCMKEKGELLLHTQVVEDFSHLFGSLYKEFAGEKSNEEAAFLALNKLGIDRTAFQEALASFSKPAHRLEWITKVKEVSYYDDSKATNVGAVLNAFENVSGKVVLLAGGKDKDLSFEPLNALKERLACVIVFGEAREKIAKALDPSIAVHPVVTVKEAVEKAYLLAKEGESVLLSPACSSLDAFANYKERGAEFRRCVMSLRGNL